jgi:NMT1-like family
VAHLGVMQGLVLRLSDRGRYNAAIMALKRPRFKRPKFERSAWREWAVILIPAVLLIAGALFLASRFIQPAPPKSIVITTGGEGGAYYKFAQRYQAALKRNGIQLEIKTSAGSMQNLTRLRGSKPEASGVLVQGGTKPEASGALVLDNTAPEASVAFVQGGTTNPEDSNNLLSLGRMFYEPLWVFHRLPADIDRLSQLQGKRVAVGPAGSCSYSAPAKSAPRIPPWWKRPARPPPKHCSPAKWMRHFLSRRPTPSSCNNCCAQTASSS